MSRLYGVNVDETRYEIKELDNTNYHTYKMIDKEKNDKYYFRNIIGLDQVGEEEFLIYDRFYREYFRIRRVKANLGELTLLFEKDFNHFSFITDDRILFTTYDRGANERNDGIYSIKDNNYVEGSKWLEGKITDVYKDSETKETQLYIKDELSSLLLDFPKLIYTVNPNTLNPNGMVYSEIRDSYLTANTKEDIDNIKIEDQKYIRNIEEHLYEEKRNKMKQVKTKLLKKES